MNFFFRTIKVMDTGISYPPSSEKYITKKILKDFLMSIVFLHEKYDVEFISSNKIKFTFDILSNKTASITKSAVPVLYCRKCEVCIEKNIDGKLQIKYDLDNRIFIFPVAIITMMLVILFILLGLEHRNAVIALFSFEAFVWSAAILMYKIMPNIIFKRKMNNVIRNL